MDLTYKAQRRWFTGSVIFIAWYFTHELAEAKPYFGVPGMILSGLGFYHFKG